MGAAMGSISSRPSARSGASSTGLLKTNAIAVHQPLSRWRRPQSIVPPWIRENDRRARR
jgi:hypothetical protein